MRDRQKHPARRRSARGTRVAAVAAVGLAAALLTGCGDQGDASAPKKVAGEAAPATGDGSPGGKDRKDGTSPSSPSDSGKGGGKDDDKAGDGQAPPGASQSEDPDAPGEGQGKGPGAGGSATETCKTSKLAFDASDSTEDSLQVHLTNTGPACTLKGFPGVALKPRGEGAVINAQRSQAAPTEVHLGSAEETSFTLHYPPNDTGGSGLHITSLLVTPPNETHSETVQADISLPVTDDAVSSITVDPVGA